MGVYPLSRAFAGGDDVAAARRELRKGHAEHRRDPRRQEAFELPVDVHVVDAPSPVGAAVLRTTWGRVKRSIRRPSIEGGEGRCEGACVRVCARARARARA